uniref:transposase n=1 Tax=Novipirellula galeiformis TaxID=2528004 RepID=UPI0036F2389A
MERRFAEVCQAETKEDANTEFDAFIEKFSVKDAAACECFRKDRDILLTFYDFAAEHWSHLRTTNPTSQLRFRCVRDEVHLKVATRHHLHRDVL